MPHAVVKRLACLYVPALALQLLLRRAALPAGSPVAVVDAAAGSRSVPPVLWLNRAAARKGVQRGMRLSEARSLCPDLHADGVEESEVAQGVEHIWQCLLQFTPSVEPDATQTGVFWLDPNGLHHLFTSPAQWAAAIHAELEDRGFYGTVAVGFNRYCTLALACTQQRYVVASDAAAERGMAARVPLAQLHWPAHLLHALQVLNIYTLGEFLLLPAGEVRQRFGADAEHIHRAAQSDTRVPLQPQHMQAPLCAEQLIEPADADHGRLLFALKSLLQPLLKSLANKSELIATLHLRLQITAKVAHHERLQPATPTLDERVLLELVRLRLASVVLPGPVEVVHVTLESVRLTPSQLTLVQQTRPRRDVRAAAQALAKIRAALGEASVTRARLVDAHLPELRFTWDAVHDVQLPTPQKPAPLILARQLFATPRPLPPPPQREPELWLAPQFGRMRNLMGPFRLQHGWWSEAAERDYYFMETSQDAVVWLYYSAPQKRWFLQGVVD